MTTKTPDRDVLTEHERRLARRALRGARIIAPPPPMPKSRRAAAHVRKKVYDK